MRRRLALATGFVALLALAGEGCIGRTLPIPPPGAMVFSESCDLATCPPAGRVVRIRGTARAGALVVAENMSRRGADGRRYVAAAFANADGGVSDGGPGDAGLALGTYEIYLGPVPVPMGPVLVSERGDTIVIYQVVRNAEGVDERSDARMETVP